MENINIILIVLGCILAIVIAYYWNMENSIAENSRHYQYCIKWKDELQQNKKDMDSNIFKGDSQIAQYNAESAQYNKECYY